MVSPQKTVTAIMMLYRNTNVKVRSSDGDTNFFNIVAGVLQGHRFVLYLFIICQDYELRMLIDIIKENGFTVKNTKSRRYPTETIMDADNADDIALLLNTPTQAEFLLHCLEQTV